jgi:catechol 2,3-dioxygenase-like lactoylglutathione lyase family enzyme
MLAANDLNETMAFYTERLGFDVIGTWGHDMSNPTWGQVGRDGFHLMFTWTDPTPHDHGDGHVHSHDPVEPALAGSIYFNVDDVDALFADVGPKLDAVEWEPETFEYGMREFAIRDPNGYMLIFGADVD